MKKTKRIKTYRYRLIEILVKGYFLEVIQTAKSNPKVFIDDEDYDLAQEEPNLFARLRSKNYLNVLMKKDVREIKALYDEYSLD